MRLIFAACFIFASVARADFDPAAIVVKVTSQKAHEAVVFGGSGVLVTYKGQTFVLTSEHVLLHDNDPSVHQIQLDGQVPVPATYVVSDWGMGLALLKADHVPASADLPDLEVLAKAASPAPGAAAMSVGFPYHATSIVADATGVVDSTTTSSEILVDVEKMLQISGAHAEFGMSGGAVLGDDSSVLAILSHENPDPVNKVIYGIPIAPAARWAIRALSDPNFKPRLVRTSSDMLLEGRYGLQIRAGLLNISWKHFPYNDSQFVVDIEPDRSWVNAPTATPQGAFYTSVLARFESYRVSPRSYPTVYVTGFRSTDFSSAQNSWTGVGSLISFFRRVKRADVRPVAMFDYQGSDPMQLDSSFNRAVDQFQHAGRPATGTALGRALDQLRDFTQYYENEDSLSTSRTYPIYFLNKDDLEYLQHAPAFANDWKADRSGALLKALTDLEALINSVSI